MSIFFSHPPLSKYQAQPEAQERFRRTVLQVANTAFNLSDAHARATLYTELQRFMNLHSFPEDRFNRWTSMLEKQMEYRLNSIFDCLETIAQEAHLRPQPKQS